MNETEPVMHDAAAPETTEPATNGSTAPAAADLPVAAAAPPPAEPVIVSSISQLEPAGLTWHNAAPAVPPSMPLPPVKTPEVEALEDRLRRLEAMLSNLADPKQLEERLAERLSKRPGQAAPVASIVPAPVATLVAPPAAAPISPSRATQLMEAGRRWLPLGLGWRAQAAPANDGRSDLRPSWLFFDILREAQSILHMYGDPRYRLTWSGRVFPVVFFLLILTSNIWLKPLTWWVPDSVSFIVTVFVKVVDLALAFCFCKVLTREARRYRELIQPYPTSPHQ